MRAKSLEPFQYSAFVRLPVLQRTAYHPAKPRPRTPNLQRIQGTLVPRAEPIEDVHPKSLVGQLRPRAWRDCPVRNAAEIAAQVLHGNTFAVQKMVDAESLSD